MANKKNGARPRRHGRHPAERVPESMAGAGQLPRRRTPLHMALPHSEQRNHQFPAKAEAHHNKPLQHGRHRHRTHWTTTGERPLLRRRRNRDTTPASRTKSAAQATPGLQHEVLSGNEIRGHQRSTGNKHRSTESLIPPRRTKDNGILRTSGITLTPSLIK